MGSDGDGGGDGDGDGESVQVYKYSRGVISPVARDVHLVAVVALGSSQPRPCDRTCGSVRRLWLIVQILNFRPPAMHCHS